VYISQLELNSYDYVNTCHVAPGYVHVLCGQAVCYSLAMHMHTHSDSDYFIGLFHSVIAYISFALLISIIKEDIWL